MSTVKRLTGDYTIDTIGATANVIVDSHTLKVLGNLEVYGNSVTITTANLAVTDNFITLNEGETGAGVTLGTAGFYIDRGTAANVGVRWNETLDKWQATENGTTWSFILQSNVGGTGITRVHDDALPSLGGNLNIWNRSIYANVANVVVYANTVGTGQTGLYVNTAVSTNRELITKTKSIIYGLIL